MGILTVLTAGRNRSGNRDDERVQAYLKDGMVPWSPGYKEYRSRYVAGALTDGQLMRAFDRGEPLPSGYGLHLDERCVECPWVISRVPVGPGTCLDAGSALNHLPLLSHPRLVEKTLHIVTLAPEHNCFWTRGVSYIYNDICDLPIRDHYYDTVISISTLEHVGFDNVLFGAGSRSGEDRCQTFLSAVRELWRVLKPGGNLLATVPFGKYQNFGTFQQFDADLLGRLLAAVDPAGADLAIYRYDSTGWALSDKEACRQTEYSPWNMLPEKERVGQAKPTGDGPAAAGSVACIRLSKPRITVETPR